MPHTKHNSHGRNGASKRTGRPLSIRAIKAGAHAKLAERLQRFRFERDLSDDKVALLIGHLSGESLRRLQRGQRVSPQTIYKVERFLERVHAR
jgi:hypothetical protein